MPATETYDISSPLSIAAMVWAITVGYMSLLLLHGLVGEFMDA